MFRVALVLFAFTVASCSSTPPVVGEFNSNGKKLPYRLLKPTDLEAGKRYPLILILHGAGERGNDNQRQLNCFWNPKRPSPMTHLEVVAAKAFVVVPQCPADKQWVEVPWSKGSYKSPEVSEPMKLTLELVDSLVKDWPIDPDRVYVVGMSMGGFGALDAVQRRPDLFAAAVPICGGGDPSKACDISHVAIWAFHGADDDVVPVSGSREMIEALKAAGGNPRYNEYPNAGHNAWDPAFGDKEFWPWIFAQKRQKK